MNAVERCKKLVRWLREESKLWPPDGAADLISDAAAISKLLAVYVAAKHLESMVDELAPTDIMNLDIALRYAIAAAEEDEA